MTDTSTIIAEPDDVITIGKQSYLVTFPHPYIAKLEPCDSILEIDFDSLQAHIRGQQVGEIIPNQVRYNRHGGPFLRDTQNYRIPIIVTQPLLFNKVKIKDKITTHCDTINHSWSVGKPIIQTIHATFME